MSMETENHKKSRFKDGGLTSDNCKCGRPWKTRHFSSTGYYRICPGCNLRTKLCHCEKIKK